MNTEPFVVKRFCPECGQKLSLPTTDLRRRFRCPRCQVVHDAQALVPKRSTVPAVPVSEFEGYEREMTPIAIDGTAPLVGDDLPPVTQPMPTVCTPEPKHAEWIARAPLPVPPPLPPERGNPQQWSPAAYPAYPAPSPIAHPAAPPRHPALSPSPPHVAVEPTPRAGVRESVGEGVAAVGRAGSVLLRLAARVDRWWGRRRMLVVSLVSASVVAAPLVDSQLEGPFASAAALTAFAAMLGILMLARIDGLRDERGWRLELLGQSLEESWDDASDWFSRVLLSKVPFGQKLLDVTRPALSVALLTLASSNVLSALAIDGLAPVAQGLWTGGLIGLGISVLLGLWGWRRLWRLRFITRPRRLAVARAR